MSAKQPHLKRPATMNDVARVAGVHKSTVSLALRDQPSIPVATRLRIQAVAAKLRYQPDPVLTAFNSQRLARTGARRHLTIAFVSDLPDRKTFDASERHREIFQGSAAYAQKQGLRLELFFIGPQQLSPARLDRILHARAISGIIVGALTTATSALPLAWGNLCGVAVESAHATPELDHLATNYREASRLVIQKLREHKCRRIGFLLAPELRQPITDQLRAGYLVEIASQTRARPLPFIHAPDREPGPLVRWLKAQRPDAIVCCGLRTLPDLPPRIHIRSIDIATSHPHTAGVPTIHQALGRRAAEMLTLRMRANLRGLPSHLSTTLLPVSWREAAPPDR